MGDPRGLLLAPMGLVLQVGHPVVGAGVMDHSNFLRDPWGRLWRTMDSAARFTYGDYATARAEAARLRKLHRNVRGTDRQGRPYHALDPAAYAWVHLTLLHVAVQTQRLLGHPLTPAELGTLYGEWRGVGLRLGVRDERMPASWEGFTRYFDDHAANVLEANEAVYQVLRATRRPPAPAPWMPDPLWQLVAMGAGSFHNMFTVGTLPPLFRLHIGLRWTAKDERTMLAAACLIRAGATVVPAPLRHLRLVAPYLLHAWDQRL